jgi:hypothetical protein
MAAFALGVPEVSGRSRPEISSTPQRLLHAPAGFLVNLVAAPRHEVLATAVKRVGLFTALRCAVAVPTLAQVYEDHAADCTAPLNRPTIPSFVRCCSPLRYS